MKLALVFVLVACSKDTSPPSAKVVEEGEGDAEPFVAHARDVLVGHRAPAVTLDLLDGNRVDLATVIGTRPIYLKFWATWCVPCREQMPHLEATFRAHKDQLAVFAVDVAIDDPIENVREMVATKKLSFPVAIDRDGSVSEQFALDVTPQHIVIDRAGIVRFVGHAVTPALERAIAAVVAPEDRASAPAPTAQTAPSGVVPPLVLDRGAPLEVASLPHAPIALTFATLFCDSYIADSRPTIGATCATHARAIEAAHRAHPELAWVVVAFPVWTSGEDIVEYRQRLGVSLPIGIDRGNAWFRYFRVRDTYTTLLLDASGAELGRVDGDGAGLDGLIAKAH